MLGRRQPLMLTKLRQHWKDFKASPPGKRFQSVHQRRAKRNGKGSAVKKWALISLGLLLTLAGIFFLAAPGPGTIVLALGLALLAGESMTVARLLDWLELKFRPLYLWGKQRWQKASPRTRLALMVSLSLLGLAAAAAGGYFFFTR